METFPGKRRSLWEQILGDRGAFDPQGQEGPRGGRPLTASLCSDGEEGGGRALAQDATEDGPCVQGQRASPGDKGDEKQRVH